MNQDCILHKKRDFEGTARHKAEIAITKTIPACRAICSVLAGMKSFSDVNAVCLVHRANQMEVTQKVGCTASPPTTPPRG